MVLTVGFCHGCHRHGYIRDSGRTGKGPVMLCKHCRHEADAIVGRLEAEFAVHAEG